MTSQPVTTRAGATRGQQTQLKSSGSSDDMITGYQGISKALAYPVLFSLILLQASAEAKKVPEAQCHELK